MTITRKNGVIQLDDHELDLWVSNDEGLYTWWKRSRLPKRRFIIENRAELKQLIRAYLERPPGR